MKLKFSNHNSQQPSISPIQSENRAGRPNSVPLFSSLIIAAVIALLAFWVYRWYAFSHIGTYAMVVGKTMEVRSPCQGEVRELALRLGDKVAAGEKVCVIAPTEFEKQLRSRDQALKAWNTAGQQTLDYWRTTGRTPGTPAAAAAPTASLPPDATDAELTRLAVKRADRVRAEKKAALERTRLLQQADAATAADLRTATLELELAELSFDQAKVTDDGARRRLGLPVVAAAAAAVPADGQDLPPAPLPLDLPPTSIEMKSVMTGQVIELAVTDGEVVAPNQKVLKVLESGTLWIETYVSSEEIQRIEEGDEVRVHLAGEEGTVLGHVTACSRVATQLPEVLGRRVKGLDNVCRVRIDLDNDATRLDCGSVIRVVIKASHGEFGSFLKSLRY